MKKYLWIFLVLFMQCRQNPVEMILFSSSRSGNSELYLMNWDGTLLEQLTMTPEDEWGAVWMNKDEISFLRQEAEGIKRYKMSTEDKKITLMDHPSACILDDKNGLFSAQGDQLYVCNGKLYWANKGGEKSHELLTAMEGRAAYPSWVSGEKSIILTHNASGNNEIYCLNLTSGAIERLTDHPANDERGSFSPDGQFLVFSSNRANASGQDILLKNLVDGTIQNLTSGRGNALISQWSRNSQSIYIGSDHDGNWEIYRYDLSNQEMFRLTNNEAFDGDPRVRP